MWDVIAYLWTVFIISFSTFLGMCLLIHVRLNHAMLVKVAPYVIMSYAQPSKCRTCIIVFNMQVFVAIIRSRTHVFNNRANCFTKWWRILVSIYRCCKRLYNRLCLSFSLDVRLWTIFNISLSPELQYRTPDIYLIECLRPLRSKVEIVKRSKVNVTRVVWNFVRSVAPREFDGSALYSAQIQPIRRRCATHHL